MQRIVRHAFLTLCGFLATAIILMIVGSLTIPLMGWGAAYVFAAGLWLLAASVVPATVWLTTAVVLRVKSSRWELGMDDPD
jgi:hypothetical protein